MRRASFLGVIVLTVGWLASPGVAAPPTTTDYTIIDLGTLGGLRSYGRGINDAGQVTGDSYTADGYVHAFVWDPVTGMSDLGTLGGTSSSGYGINDAGQVTGWALTADGYRRAFVLDPATGVMSDLGTLGGIHSWGYGINDAGQVTGYSFTADGYGHAVVWVTVDLSLIEDLIGAFDTAVSDDLLVAEGGKGNLVAFRNKLTNVAMWLEGGFTNLACTALTQAAERTDGLADPEDWITGPAASQIHSDIQAMITSLGCT